MKIGISCLTYGSVEILSCSGDIMRRYFYYLGLGLALELYCLCLGLILGLALTVLALCLETKT